MSRRPASLLLAALALTLGGCASQLRASPSSEPGRPVRSAPELPTVPPSDEPVTGEVPAEIMADLVADAAERTGADAEAFEVVQAMAITWNDGSLGCPEPGMAYTMALVEGYHVILESADEELDYRVTADGGFRLCETGVRPAR